MIRLITILLFIASFSEATTYIKDPQNITPEMRQKINLKSLAGRLRHGETVKTEKKITKTLYTATAFTGACSFDLKARSVSYDPQCKKTKEIKSTIKGKTRVRTIADCKISRKQKEKIKIDIKTDSFSKGPSLGDNSHKVVIGDNSFYFVRQSHAENFLKDLDQYKTKFCSK